MRRAAFEINGTWVEGHFAREKYEVGDIYEMRNSGKVMVVEHVFDGEFEVREDGTGWFYRLRPATQEEIEQWQSGISADQQKADFDKFFDRVNFFN